MGDGCLFKATVAQQKTDAEPLLYKAFEDSAARNAVLAGQPPELPACIAPRL